jgi:N-acetyl sugar amidotransferase
MKYCKICLQPDTRPNSFFTDDGFCPACIYFEETMKDIIWENRLEEIKGFIKNYKRKPGQYFDCIIGVSGGKDSTRQALWVRDKLKLKPLLVCLSYPPEQVTERGMLNISNLIELGFDVIVSSLSPQTWKELLKRGFSRYTNWAKASEQAILSAVPQVAINYGIEIIFWGENPGLQLGDLKTIGKTGWDGNNLKYMNTVAGGGIEWMLEEGIERQKLNPFIYPLALEFDNAKIQIIYLGWLWQDWSLINNAKYSCVEGLEIRTDTVENTGDLWGVTSLDEDWVTLNQMIKYYKYGFGRVSDYVNEQIRRREITREDGILLLEKYDNACSPEYIESFCSYIEISVEEFWDKVYGVVNKDLFSLKTDGTIIRKFKIGIGL